MQIVVDLDIEQISKMVYAELLEQREMFLEDLENESPCVFDCNPVYDKALILEHIKALDVLLEWYRDPSDS